VGLHHGNRKKRRGDAKEGKGKKGNSDKATKHKRTQRLIRNAMARYQFRARGKLKKISPTTHAFLQLAKNQPRYTGRWETTHKKRGANFRKTLGIPEAYDAE